jgi:tRNA (guanine-N7-)-methyltransferase
MLDPAPGIVGVSAPEFPPLPDTVIHDPRAGYLDPRAWFSDPGRPFEIEIGSGKGTFLIQHAEKNPGVNFLGIEWAREFYEYAADRIRRRRAGLTDEETGADALDQPPARALTHVRMLNTDAAEFLRWRTPDAIARAIHLYFSDPWPKTRHQRRRVIQDQFLFDAGRVLQPGGELRIVTDHDELWAWDCAHFQDWARPSDLLDAQAAASAQDQVAPHRREQPNAVALPGPEKPFEIAPFVRPDSADQGELVGTNFERKYRRQGRPFHAVVLRRVGPA